MDYEILDKLLLDQSLVVIKQQMLGHFWLSSA